MLGIKKLLDFIQNMKQHHKWAGWNFYLIFTCCKATFFYWWNISISIIHNFIEFTKSRQDFIHTQKWAAATKIFVFFNSSPVEVRCTFTLFQNFLIRGFKKAITYIIPRIEFDLRFSKSKVLTYDPFFGVPNFNRITKNSTLLSILPIWYTRVRKT